MGTAGVVELELLFVPKFDPIVIDSSYWGGGTSSSATWVFKYDIGWKESFETVVSLQGLVSDFSIQSALT